MTHLHEDPKPQNPLPFPEEEAEEEEIVISEKRVRPGGIGRTVAYILLFSLILVIIAWVGLETWAQFFVS